jgi:hypothetical protein
MAISFSDLQRVCWQQGFQDIMTRGVTSRGESDTPK